MFSFAEQLERFVCGNAVEPTWELGFVSIEIANSSIHIYQRVLQNIFGIVMAHNNAANVPVEPVAIGVDKLAECRLFCRFLSDEL